MKLFWTAIDETCPTIDALFGTGNRVDLVLFSKKVRPRPTRRAYDKSREQNETCREKEKKKRMEEDNIILHGRSDPSFRQSSKSLLERELLKRMDLGYRSRPLGHTPPFILHASLLGCS